MFGRGPKAFLTPEQEAWQIETFAWLGGRAAIERAPLVLPTAAFFPATEATGHARAAHVFDAVSRLSGTGDLHCRLEPQPARGGPSGVAFAEMRRSGAVGTYGVEGNTPIITYDPAEIAQPMRLIAVFAHELAHIRNAAIPSDPPGGPEMTEPATDLTTIATGFGLFGATTAFEFRQHQDTLSQGWSTRRLGYLTEREWVFGLAVFLAVAGGATGPLRRWLKPHLWTDLLAAARTLDRRPGLLDGLA